MEMIGQTIGNYRIDRLLGEGGMGPVYQAYHLSLMQDVAIKLIDPRLTHQSSFRERFTHEARLLSEVDHPGIVKVLDFGQHRDQLYVVMEYIPGLSLRGLLDDLIKARRWLPLPEAMLLIEQLCQAITSAEEHRLLRKDIKPSNLMLKPEPAEHIPFQIVLTDLGLSQLLDASGATPADKDPGKHTYLSPEQLLGKPTDSRSTVYSVGTLLYELAVGVPPFSIEGFTDALIFHTQQTPPAPRSIRPELPNALEQVILTALEKEPDQRYQTVADLENALQRVHFDSTAIEGPGDQTDISLATEYTNSLIASVMPESRSTTGKPKLGQTEPQPAFVPDPELSSPRFSIEVLIGGREIQRLPLTSDAVFIGRDSENQIMLDDQEVSRRHAQITTDGSNYYVTDLQSRNGTYIEGRRLPVDTPYLWKPRQEVHICGFVLRLHGQASAQTIVKDSDTELIRMTAAPQQLAVEAGGTSVLNLLLLNQSAEAEQFSLIMTGIPSHWVVNLPDQVMLIPGMPKEITCTLHIPRSDQTPAGRHPFSLRVSRQSNPSQFWETRLTLTVAAFSQFAAELQPRRLRSRQIGQLVIANQGNIQELFRVQFTDSLGGLVFQPPELRVRIPPGKSAAAEFRADVRPSLLNFFGGERAHAFNTQVSLSNGEAQTLHGDLISRPMIPGLVLVLGMVFCLFLAGSAAALWWFYTSRSATVEVSTLGSGVVTSSPEGINCGTTCSYGFDKDSTILLTAAPIPPSTFGGWGGAACSPASLTCEIKLSDSQTVTAMFNPPGVQSLIVTKTGTGTGTVTSSPLGIDCGSACTYTFLENTSVTLNAAPVPPSTFGGWSGTICAGTGPCNVTMSEVRSVVATFNTPGKQTLLVSKGGTGSGTVTSSPAGIDCGTTCSFEFTENDNVTLIAQPASPSTFAGWSGGSCTGTGPCVVSMNTAQTVTATFHPPGNQRLTISKAGSGSGTITSSPAGIDCGSACFFDFAFDTTIRLTAAPVAPSTFTGWGGACSGTSVNCDVKMNAIQNVTATFTSASSQKLTVSKAGTGSGTVTSFPTGINCGSACLFDFAFDTTVRLTATPTPPSTFAGWSGACSGTSATCDVRMNAIQNVTAMFNPPGNQTLTVIVNGNGNVTIAPNGVNCSTTCPLEIPFETEITLTANPSSPSTFSGWSGGTCSANPCTFRMTSPQTISASFAAPGNQTLIVTRIGNGTVSSTGIDCGADCSESYPFNTEVSLTFTLGSEATFIAWSGACSGRSTCRVTMNTIQSVTAIFNTPPRITSNDGGSTATIQVAENSTGNVTTVIANDPDGSSQTLNYSIIGEDSGLFNIDSSTGALSFRQIPDFDNPTDADDNNVYKVILRVTDSFGASDEQSMEITVTNASDSP